MSNFIRNGTYRIRSSHPINNSNYLGLLANNSITAATLVANNDAQRWRVTTVSEGAYRIMNVAFEGRFMSTTGAGNLARIIGAPIESSQTWTIDPRGASFVIGNAANAAALHITEQAMLRAVDRNNSQNQRWFFEVINLDPAQDEPGNTGGTIPNPQPTALTLTPLLLLECYQQPGSPGQLSTVNIVAPSGQTFDRLTIYMTTHGRFSYYTTADVYLVTDGPGNDDINTHYLAHNNASWVPNTPHMAVPILDVGKVILLGRLYQGSAPQLAVSTERHFDINLTVPANYRLYMTVRTATDGHQGQFVGTRATLRRRANA